MIATVRGMQASATPHHTKVGGYTITTDPLPDEYAAEEQAIVNAVVEHFGRERVHAAIILDNACHGGTDETRAVRVFLQIRFWDSWRLKRMRPKLIEVVKVITGDAANVDVLALPRKMKVLSA